MRADPPVRKDGRCAVCLKARDPERSHRYAEGLAHLDPFCSSSCARRYHGTTLPETLTGPRPSGPLVHGTEHAYKHGCRCFYCTEESTNRRGDRRRRQATA